MSNYLRGIGLIFNVGSSSGYGKTLSRILNKTPEQRTEEAWRKTGDALRGAMTQYEQEKEQSNSKEAHVKSAQSTN